LKAHNLSKSFFINSRLHDFKQVLSAMRCESLNRLTGNKKKQFNFMTFTTYYDGKAVLFSNTEFEKSEILNRLLDSEFGEISIGYYRFVLIE